MVTGGQFLSNCHFLSLAPTEAILMKGAWKGHSKPEIPSPSGVSLSGVHLTALDNLQNSVGLHTVDSMREKRC